MSSDEQVKVRGRIKQQCEDFDVEEVPAYLPSGEGEHLYLWVEKIDVSAGYALRQLASLLGVPRDEIGSAGNKDRRAVTRQYYSVPARLVSEEVMARLPGKLSDQIEVLRVERHGNKLRRGHLRGNRFALRVRLDEAMEEAQEQDLRERVEKLRAQGMPNFYGSQRFGRESSTVALGEGLLRGDRDAERRAGRDRFLKRLALNAVQSALFNACLTRRIEDGALDRVLEGDVLERLESGGRFVSEDQAVDQERMDAGELVATGPMFGPKMLQARGEVGAREAAVLEERGLTLGAFGRFGKSCAGARRAYKVMMEALELEIVSPQEVMVRFFLPSGSYATVLLGELFDVDVDGDSEDSEGGDS